MFLVKNVVNIFKYSFVLVIKMNILRKLYTWFYTVIVQPFNALIQDISLIYLHVVAEKRYLDDDVLLTKFRTNAHILDKGLQTDDWTAGRAVGKYKFCIELLKCLEHSKLVDDSSYNWALSKVQEYESAQAGKIPKQKDYIPIHNDVKTREMLLEIIKSRRCVRFFCNRPIEKQVLEQLIEVVNWSPISCNRQPAMLHITQNTELIRKCLKLCAGSTCFSEISPPCFIAVCADMRVFNVLDRHTPIIDVSLGIQNLLLLSHTYGIEGTILNWMQAGRKENKALRHFLEIPKYQRILFNIALGYPAKLPPVPGRKDVVRTYKMHC